jgi:hypothetical protein
MFGVGQTWDDIDMASLLPPSSSLPSMLEIASRSPKDLQEALRFLRSLYYPEVRGSRRRCTSACRSLGESGRLSKADADLDYLRSDVFERSYSIRWLTALIAQVESQNCDSSMATLYPSSKSREDIIEEAASLLAICAGPASAGVFTRVFTFTSSHAQCTIQVQLTDAPLENNDFSSVGAQTWGGACVLAEKIVEHPEQFRLIIGGASSFDGASGRRNELRVLELGAGTGLVSLTLAKLLESPGDWTADQTTVVATDFHASVLANLRANIASNFADVTDQHPRSSISVRSHFLDWSTFSAAEELTSPFDHPFHLILGADIVYEAQHAMWIKACLARLLHKPPVTQPGDSGIFHLVIPLRPTHTSESSTVEEVFPQREVVVLSRQRCQPMELCILSKGTVVCDAHSDDKDEIEYAHYQIGWC